ESRDKIFREAWSNVQQQGQELARKTVSLTLDNNSKEKRLGEILQDRDTVHRRLTAVETEFKTFQDEITKIFREKDAEEADTRTRIATLEEANALLDKDLQKSREQNSDDEHRLTIFQEEVGELHVDKERAEEEIGELS